MKVVTLLNEKGGVGKTTLGTTLAAGLAIKGATTLLIDADPQGHASLMIGLQKENKFYQLVVEGKPFFECAYGIPPENYTVDGSSQGTLLVIPGNIATAGIYSTVSHTEAGDFTILDRLEEIVDDIDYVIFDTSPTPSDLHKMIYMATDLILYPTLCEFLSIDGIEESLKRLKSANRIRRGEGLPNIAVGGFVPNKYRRNTLEHEENLALLKETFGELVMSPIRDGIVWAEASKSKRTIFGFAPDTTAGSDANAFVSEFQTVLGVQS